jgi:hypothetical protein
MVNSTSTEHDTQRALQALVVKQGVGLGGLAPAERALALALAWAALPVSPMSERDVNVQLQQALAGPALCLDTDHVELRRWLVDSGFLQRDGFGREYRRVAAAALPEDLRPAAAALQGLDVAAFATATRAAHAQQRQARREAWAAAGGARP